MFVTNKFEDNNGAKWEQYKPESKETVNNGTNLIKYVARETKNEQGRTVKNRSSEEKNLLVVPNLIIEKGNHYGLIVRNNIGKSDYLKYINNLTLPGISGNDIVHWKRECYSNEAISAFQIAVNGRSNVSPEDEMKARAILLGLGVPLKYQDVSVKELSCSLKMRVFLAKELFIEPNLLILEEPTSILDINAVIWLENYLRSWCKTLIIISQDRCFLDQVTTNIIQANNETVLNYRGNFSRVERKIIKKQKRKIKKGRLQALGNIKSEKVENKQKGALTNMNGNKSEVSTAQDCKIQLSFPNIVPSKLPVVQLLNVTFGYETEKPLFKKLGLTIGYGSRVGILGPEGIGKSTFLNLLSGQLNPQDGEIVIESGIKIRKFDEFSGERLPPEQTPIDYIMKKYNLQINLAQEKLHNVGLGSDAYIKIKRLTKNQKARVAVTELCLDAFDGLLLDEPTKYMDLDLIDALSDAIIRFKGGVVLVSNNEFLLRETECDINVIKDGDVFQFDGDFDTYRKNILTELGVRIHSPIVYKRKSTVSRENDTSPIILKSESEIIKKYVDEKKADPSILEIGKYKIVFEETTTGFACFSPILDGVFGIGKTKYLCEKNMREGMELYIETLIELGQEVPLPD